MTEKRYFWIKLKKDFFQSKEMKMLRRIAGGAIYTIIYQKLLLISMADEGRIFYEGIAENLAEELSLIIDESAEDIHVAITLLAKMGLISASDTELEMVALPEMVGSETAAAERMRRSRARERLQGEEKTEISVENRNNVTPVLQDVTQSKSKSKSKSKSIDTELDTEKELDTEIKPLSDKSDGACSEIVTFLNEKTGSRYKVSTPKTVRLIEARLKEGFTVADFHAVIEKKNREWSGTEMEKYLRPETLFGTKFEGYLNQPVTPKESGNAFLDLMADLEAME